MSDFLVAEGIPAFAGYSSDHLSPEPDLVVVGNAISRGNAELETVLERRLRHCSMPEAIRDFFLWDALPVVMAGTHGKTTSTALTGWLLTHGQLDPSVLIGGVALDFGPAGSSYRVGKGPHFVIEGDEYDSAFFDKTAKFLKYLPEVAVVGNVEFDHADIYDDLDAVLLAFRRLVRLVPRTGLVLLGADSPHAAGLRDAVIGPVETFGLSDGADWQARGREPPRRHDVFSRDTPGASVRRLRIAAARRPQRAQRPGRDCRRGARRPHALGAGRRAPLLPRHQAPARAGGGGAGRDGARRLRASSDGRARDAGCRAHGVSGTAHLGRVRAAVRILVQARLPGGVRGRVRRGRRGRGGPGVSIVPARERALVGGAARRGPDGAPSGVRARCRRWTPSWRPSRATPHRGTWSS